MTGSNVSIPYDTCLNVRVGTAVAELLVDCLSQPSLTRRADCREEVRRPPVEPIGPVLQSYSAFVPALMSFGNCVVMNCTRCLRHSVLESVETDCFLFTDVLGKTDGWLSFLYVNVGVSNDFWELLGRREGPGV